MDMRVREAMAPCLTWLLGWMEVPWRRKEEAQDLFNEVLWKLLLSEVSRVYVGSTVNIRIYLCAASWKQIWLKIWHHQYTGDS